MHVSTSQKFQLFIHKCRRLTKLQRLAVGLGYDDINSIIDAAHSRRHDNRSWTRHTLFAWVILPELRRFAPAVQEFCILEDWPPYYECKRRQDGSFVARLTDVTDGRRSSVWPSGLHEEELNSNEVNVDDYRDVYTSDALRLSAGVWEEYEEGNLFDEF